MTNNASKDNSSTKEEIDLRELFLFFWKNKMAIIAVTSLFAVSSIISALNTPNEYRATVSLAPNESDNSGISNSIANSLGGLSSIAGINFGSPTTNEKTVAMERMTSWGFMESFINEYQIEAALAATGWDQARNQFRIDDDFYDLKKNEWKKDKKGNSYQPSSWASYESLLSRVSISEDLDTGIIYFSIDYYSPILAAEWTVKFIDFVNENMKQRKLDQTTRNIEYLRAEIEKTSNAKIIEIFYKLIESETKDKMLAAAAPEYVFSTVSKVMVPEKKIRPVRSKMVIFATVGGGILSILALLLIYLFRQEKFRI